MFLLSSYMCNYLATENNASSCIILGDLILMRGNTSLQLTNYSYLLVEVKYSSLTDCRK